MFLFTFFCYNETDISSLKTKHEIYPCERAVSRDACEHYHVFTKKVHCQTSGRSVRCFESSASSKRRWHRGKLREKATCGTAVVRRVTSNCTEQHGGSSASVREDASSLVHREGVDGEVRRLRTLHGDNRRTQTR